MENWRTAQDIEETMEQEYMVRETSSRGTRKTKSKGKPDDVSWQLRSGIEGGPLDPELLVGFLGHVAHDVWNGKERGPLLSPNRKKLLNSWDYSFLPSEVQKIVAKSGLGLLHAATFDYIDLNLISAFVERWHPETNSFHMPWGEMTITLHDVFYLLKIPVDGAAICVSDSVLDEVLPTAAEFLNMDAGVLKASSIEWRRGGLKFTTIRKTVNGEVDTGKYATAYLLYLVGATLFTDKSENTVNSQFLMMLKDLKKVPKLSWGSAALAFLYRQLGIASRSKCKEISGYMTLLQAWIFAYFPHFAPEPRVGWTDTLPFACKWETSEVKPNQTVLTNYRRQLDGLSESQVMWSPFRIMPASRVKISLFSGFIHCRDISEPYMPERVLCQFGYIQNVPTPPLECSSLYLGANVLKYRRRSTAGPADFRRALMAVIHPPGFTSVCTPRNSVTGDYMYWYLPLTHPRVHNGVGIAPQQLHDREEVIDRSLGVLNRMHPSNYPGNWSNEDLTSSMKELCTLWDRYITKTKPARGGEGVRFRIG